MAIINIATGNDSKEFSADHVRVIETDMISISEWLFNAMEELHRRTLHQIILKNTEYNPNKLSLSEKYDLIKDFVLDTKISEENKMSAPLTITIGEESREYDKDFIRVLEFAIPAQNEKSIPDYLSSIFEAKHEKVLDKIVLNKTNKNPEKLSIVDKHVLLEAVTLESAVDRNIRFENEMMAL